MCVLRADGSGFDVDRFVARTSLPRVRHYRRGEPRRPQRRSSRHETSGLVIPVSDSSSSDLPRQVADAEEFLARHRKELLRLRRCAGVEWLVLDFPVRLRIGKKIRGQEVAAQFDRFPASLVRAAGSLDIALELSLYP
jgi:hypothetical protein